MRFTSSRKTITWIVVWAFLFFLRTSAWPRAMESKSHAASYEAGVKEKIVTDGKAPAKKRFPLLPVIIGAAALTTVLILLLHKSKTKYDIRGNWTLAIEYAPGNPTSYPVEFSGSAKSGSLQVIMGGDTLATGTYQVSDKNVTLVINWEGGDVANLTGAFSSTDNMAGTYTETPNWQGNWQAVRSGAGTTTPPVR